MKIFTKLLGGVLVLTLLSPYVSFGQEQDLSAWTRLAVKYDFSKRTRMAIEEEFRFKNNITELGQNHTEIGISHEITKRFEGGVYYRFIYETDPERFYSLGHRAWVQLEYQLIDRDITVSVRNRTQTTYEDVFSSDNGKIPEWYTRYKIGSEYHPKRADWIPNVSLEFWQFLNPGSKPNFDKFRVSAGLEYRPGKHFRYEVFYSFQQELQQKNPMTDYILGFNVTYMIN